MSDDEGKEDKRRSNEWTTGEEKSGEVKKKRGPRRRRQQEEKSTEEEKETAPVKKEIKRTEGWGEGPMKEEEKVVQEDVGTRRSLAAEGEEEEEAEVLIIPDLDEQEKEDIIFQVAEAPRNISRKLPGLEELNGELVSLSISSSEKRLDLSALTSRLVPIGQVQEPKEPWDFDSLLQAVTQDFVNEAQLDSDLAENTKEEDSVFAKAAQSANRAARRRSTVTGGRRAKPKAEQKSAPDTPADDNVKNTPASPPDTHHTRHK